MLLKTAIGRATLLITALATPRAIFTTSSTGCCIFILQLTLLDTCLDLLIDYLLAVRTKSKAILVDTHSITMALCYRKVAIIVVATGDAHTVNIAKELVLRGLSRLLFGTLILSLGQPLLHKA